MELVLTTWERVMLCTVMNSQRGDVGVMRKASKLLDVLELSAEERSAIGYVESGRGAAWQDDSVSYHIAIPDGNLAVFLVDRVKDYQDWYDGRKSAALFDKLGIEDDVQGVQS